jgi:hypothetical protein
MRTISGLPFTLIGSGMSDRSMYRHRTASGTEYTLIESSDGRSVKHVIQQAGGKWSEVHDTAEAAVAAMQERERGLA